MGSPSDFPLHLASTEAFARVKDFFHQAAFDEGAVCRALGIEQMSDLRRVDREKTRLEGVSPALGWCVEIFLRRGQTGEEESRKLCGEQTSAALQSLGLLQPIKKDSDVMRCPVWLYPVAGFVIASDRPEDPDDHAHGPAPDVVFPAIYGGTLRFLRLLPPADGCDALDLCGGTGIGALQFSRRARSAVTADITPRAAFFAEFNARLNGARVQSCCGDLYEPLNQRQFDVISAHPPFVPATVNTMAYRDAGDTGEEVTRRIVAGLPTHLRPGGTCALLCVARDTQEETFEQRARGWLGDSQDEFDIVFGLEKILPVDEVVHSLRKGNVGFDEDQARRLRVRLEALGTRQFVYGSLAIRRYPQRLGLQPSRVHLTHEGGAEDFDRLLAWRHFCRGAGFSQWLADSRPRPSKQLELTARHVIQAGELTPAEFVFSVEAGMTAALRPDGWIVPLVARLNGTKSPREIFESARLAGELPEGFGLDPFLNLIGRMIELGLLEVEFRNMMTITPYADAAHRSQVVALWETVFGYDAPHNKPGVAIDKKLAASDGLLFVAMSGDSVVGTIMAGYDGHRGWIYSVAVSPAFRRQRVGSRLMAFAEKALIEKGCMKINLQIMEGNESVAAFYASLGFAVEKRVSMGKRIAANIPS